MRAADALVSVVVPVLDEEDCVEELARRVSASLEPSQARLELIFVDDGSRDATPERIAALCERDERVKCIRFARSFGHQAALMAGLAHASGDAVITMDGDLQHPPEVLPELLASWRAGADVVHTVRRHGQSRPGLWKRVTSRGFYRLMSVLTDVPVIAEGADFRLLDRRVADHLVGLDERLVFIRGLVPWLGFRSAEVAYEADPRFAGETKFTSWRMLRLALNGIFSFSILPLRLISLLGMAITLFGVGYGVFALWAWLTDRVTGPPGWTSLMVVILIFGGVQLLSIGIVSEYLGRVYEEVKRRPRYVIESLRGLEGS